MIDRDALLADLKKQVGAVVRDLEAQLKALPAIKDRLHEEWATAKKLGRTAATETSWRDERIIQVAAAWVLGTVFVRFCEDNELITEPYLTGPTNQRREFALARYEAYVDTDPSPSYEGWLKRAFAELGAGQAGKLLFDPGHNPLFQIPLSHDGARDLVEFWRERDEHGVLVHDFTDPLDADGINGWDTRFLGDLYQDLSEEARKNYALLQTPEFVEEFILDRTLEPAVREFGYEELEMIDPTCGSGHFVLGAFRRLLQKWADNHPTKDRHERVRAALRSVHGVDINPFAIAIARFRLLVAAMAAANIRTLAEAANYEWPIKLAVGDSLIKARQLELPFDGMSEGDPLAEFSYATEDVHEYPRILEPGRYHVVVGNPPYITVKDKSLNELYRQLYGSCAGTYALTVPFAERLFELARTGSANGDGFGRVGQITANSFMKREFGTKLIEEFFAHRVALTEVIDTSGAYIPGHGTPTVILIGIRQSGKGRSSTVRTVRSVQGEPNAPARAEEGFVWRAIVEQIDTAGSVSQWVSVEDLDRERYFGKQPWVLVDGGLELIERMEASCTLRSKKFIEPPIGRAIRAGADDAYIRPYRSMSRTRVDQSTLRPLVKGEIVRDWSAQPEECILYPYGGRVDGLENELWPWRRALETRRTFQGDMAAAGLKWWEYMQFTPSAYRANLSITFAFVATHNHFVLDRGGKVFKQSAPVIKLPEGTSEEEHLKLLGLLNSSTACFWLKMVSHGKGNGGVNEGLRGEKWEEFFEFTGTKLENFPLPSQYPCNLSHRLDELAKELDLHSPARVVAKAFQPRTELQSAREKWHFIRGQMIALQEELDWQVYSIYKLHDAELCAPEGDIPAVACGERAFEIVKAELIQAGKSSAEWFTRHGYAPVTGIPEHWPASYKRVVQRRIEAIESNRAIGMIERPEYKRRWATEGWDALQEKALRAWLLDRMESHDLWFDENDQPTILTLPQFTDRLARDEDFLSVAALYAPNSDFTTVVAGLITDEHVPFLAALRYKPSGMKKRADWESVWAMQREEDDAPTEDAKRRIREKIPVPPKYAQADFLRSSYWQARGKLDVPKERFISYGHQNLATPSLYGWAGWDHREQAQALATYFTNHSLSTEEITPLLAGLLELQPWLQQWHNEYDDLYSGSPAAFFAGYRQTVQGEHGLTDDDLRAWRPQPAGRGRGGRRKVAAAAGGE